MAKEAHATKAGHVAKDAHAAKDGHSARDGHATHAKAATPTAQNHAGSPRSGLLSSRRRELPARRTEGYTEERFITHQRHALDLERATYLEQAKSLRAEAESLVEEMEPGDIQFDDESGEGGTVTVDRERDLALSAQALVAVDEIDHALAKMATRTYGICENCGRLVPKARLEALPYARLCIDCKSGGLSRR
ncbi:MAG: TraR/DksA family transcriptional regulator [Acidimicrobiales bacterium]